MAKIKSDNWRELPIEDWNVATFKAYLVHLTAEKFGVTYEPRGKGSKAQRWARESGMMKNAAETYGNAELKRFIEICVNNYKPKPEYPHLTFAFAWGFMREKMPVAQAEIAKEKAKEERKQQAEEVTQIDEDFF